MKFQTVTALALSLAEATYIHDVLCPRSDLSELAEELHDSLAQGIDTANNSGINPDDVEVELTISAGLLEEITPLFSKRSIEKNRVEGIEASFDLGYAVAETLVEATLQVRRAKVATTLAELKSFTQEPHGPTVIQKTTTPILAAFARAFGGLGGSNN